MSDTRKGFLTDEEQEQADFLWKNSGLLESVDGVAISIADNQGLERLKPQILAKYPDALPLIYEIVDAIFAALPKETK